MDQSLHPTMAGAIMQQGLVWLIEPNAGLGYWNSVRDQPLSLHRRQFFDTLERDGAGSLPPVARQEAAYFQLSDPANESGARVRSYYDESFVGEPHEAANEKAFVLNSDGIAQFGIDGPMTKQVSWSANGTSTVYLRRIVSLAERDPDVKGGLIKIDSPGGSVAGTDDLAKALASFAAKKPLFAFAEDFMASAAYWAGCSCTKIYATTTSHIGSIGTILVIPDMSKMADKMGVEVLVFTSDGADLKGSGAPGTAVTDKQKAYFRGTVNGMQAHFSRAVMGARGLSLDQIKSLGGRVFIADQAQARGLIDGICSYQDCAAQLTSFIKQPRLQPLPGKAPQSKAPQSKAPQSKAPQSKAPQSKAPQTGRKPEASNTPPASGSHSPKTGANPPQSGKKEPSMANAKELLASIGHLLSGGVVDAEDDLEVQEVMPDVNVVTRRPGQPLQASQIAVLTACATAGLSSSADVHRLKAKADEGMEAKAALLADCEAQAIRLLGADAAKKAVIGLDVLPISMLVETREKYRAQANARVGITETTGADRTSAGGELPQPKVGQNAEQQDAPPDETEAAYKAGAAYARKANGPGVANGTGR